VRRTGTSITLIHISIHYVNKCRVRYRPSWEQWGAWPRRPPLDLVSKMT